MNKPPVSLNLSEKNSSEAHAIQEPPILIEMLPSLVQELQQLLIEHDEPGLAAQLPRLRIVDRCDCGDDFCAMFYVLPKPNGDYGPNHRNVALTPDRRMLILDVVSEKIAAVEVLYREDVRKVIDAI